MAQRLCDRCQEQQDFCFYAVLLSWSNIAQEGKANSHREPFAQTKDSITLTPEPALVCFSLLPLLGASGTGMAFSLFAQSERAKQTHFLGGVHLGLSHPTQERDSGFLSPSPSSFQIPMTFFPPQSKPTNRSVNN